MKQLFQRTLLIVTLTTLAACSTNPTVVNSTADKPAVLPSTPADLTSDPVRLLSTHAYGNREKMYKRQQLIGLALIHEDLRLELFDAALERLANAENGAQRAQHYGVFRHLRATEALPTLEQHWEQTDTTPSRNTFSRLDPHIQLLETLATLYTGDKRIAFLNTILQDKDAARKSRFHALLLLGRIGGEQGATIASAKLKEFANPANPSILSEQHRMAEAVFNVYEQYLLWHQPVGEGKHETASHQLIVLTGDHYSRHVKPSLFNDIELESDHAPIVRMTLDESKAWQKANPESARRSPVLYIHSHPTSDTTIRDWLKHDLHPHSTDHIFTLSTSYPGHFRTRNAVFRQVDGRWVLIYFGGGFAGG